MKKLFILLVLVAFTLSVSAQRASSTTTVGATGLKNLVMLPVDTITQGATAYWTFDVNRQRAYYYAVGIALDMTGATNRYSVTVWGSLNNTDWISSGITQVNCYPTAGGGVDSTLVMANVTTPQLWRYLKVRFVGLDNNVKGVAVSALGIKVADVR
jgi:hypothetical protein